MRTNSLTTYTSKLWYLCYRQMQPTIMDTLSRLQISYFASKKFSSLESYPTFCRTFHYWPRYPQTRDYFLHQGMVGLLDRITFSEQLLEIHPWHFSIPHSLHSIQPTVSLGIPRQAAHTVALSVTCLQPSVRGSQ